MRESNQRLGVVLSTVTDASPDELVALGQLAETLGYESVLVNEGRSDALALAQAIAAGTSRVTVGTNIANIYFRHPFLCASTARVISDLSGGRVLLGLGMSHRGLLARLGIDMGTAREALRDYAGYVQRALAGQVAEGFMAPPPSTHKVQVHVAGNTVESAAVAGAVGDGLMPFLSPLGYLPTLLDAARTARAASELRDASFECCLSIPTFISDDEDAARSAARYNLAFFAQLPTYRRQWRRAGYGAAMDAIKQVWAAQDRRAAATKIPDELVDEVCVFGSPARCLAQLEAFRRAGVNLPVLAVSPVNEDRLTATRRALAALAPGAEVSR
jgi:alkanesulfonate monooxygenase SsuD/methylene tetrahydromethanopterin reductase-like flavin-dependent oxidoreductase (luciferase family)